MRQKAVEIKEEAEEEIKVAPEVSSLLDLNIKVEERREFVCRFCESRFGTSV